MNNTPVLISLGKGTGMNSSASNFTHVSIKCIQFNVVIIYVRHLVAQTGMTYSE